MKGVEFLTSKEVATTYGFSWEIFITVFVIGVIVFTIWIGVMCFYDIKGWSFLVGAIVGAIVGSFFGYMSAAEEIPIEYETQYKVTISDEVLMNDFLEKYEIIEQDGKIYTIREKIYE